MKKYLFVIIMTVTFLITSCSNSSSNVKKYLDTGSKIDTNAKDVMPVLDDLPEYEEIEYKYTHKSIVLFESHSVALIVSYDDETYNSEKDKLNEKYTFLVEKVPSSFDVNKSYVPEYEFSVNSYTFKVVAGDGADNTQFPKSFGMIGTSDEKKSIAYLYFYDEDLDFIGKENEINPMGNFVNEYFDYEF